MFSYLFELQLHNKHYLNFNRPQNFGRNRPVKCLRSAIDSDVRRRFKHEKIKIICIALCVYICVNCIFRHGFYFRNNMKHLETYKQ